MNYWKLLTREQLSPNKKRPTRSYLMIYVKSMPIVMFVGATNSFLVYYATTQTKVNPVHQVQQAANIHIIVQNSLRWFLYLLMKIWMTVQTNDFPIKE